MTRDVVTERRTTMNVGEICTRQPVTVQELDDLTAAAELMRSAHVGYVVVVEPGPADRLAKPTGVLTDRDIVVNVVSKKLDPRSLRVGDVMTRHLVLAEEAMSVDSALVQMRKHGVRRLPVLASTGYLVGVISLEDILRSLAGELENVVVSMRNERVAERASRP
jgi:CBS domain-containing protein